MDYSGVKRNESRHPTGHCHHAPVEGFLFDNGRDNRTIEELGVSATIQLQRKIEPLDLKRESKLEILETRI